ncbi:hypothetical protein FJTKL_01248 [Diaporthe vaccinii]|uniref:Uncharacterized protein n=1 Tax=Diaporthe vaccinii TaxID=105482 RepID=A0ABR4E185_9PEZI
MDGGEKELPGARGTIASPSASSVDKNASGSARVDSLPSIASKAIAQSESTGKPETRSSKGKASIPVAEASSSKPVKLDTPEPPGSDDEDDDSPVRAKKGTPNRKKDWNAADHRIIRSFVKVTKKGPVTVNRKGLRYEPCSACVDRAASGKGNRGCHLHDDVSSSRCFDCHRGGAKCSTVALSLQPVGYALYNKYMEREPSMEPDYRERNLRTAWKVNCELLESDPIMASAEIRMKMGDTLVNDFSDLTEEQVLNKIETMGMPGTAAYKFFSALGEEDVKGKGKVAKTSAAASAGSASRAQTKLGVSLTVAAQKKVMNSLIEALNEHAEFKPVKDKK